ncbi:MAG: twin-arginine translocase subunit TatC, partial [Raoultibacter sp.]
NPAFQWLTDQAQGFAQVMPEAKLWIDIIIKFELGFGFAFELPLIIFYLVMFDVVSYSKLRKSWRMVYLMLLIISAMVTPDASPVTMALMFAAMVVLYEGSLLIARLALGKRVKKQKEELEREAAEEEEWQAEREAKKLKKLAEDDEA